MYNILSRVNNGEESIKLSYRLSKMIVCEVFPIVIVNFTLMIEVMIKCFKGRGTWKNFF